jgi:hypothetical protein
MGSRSVFHIESSLATLFVSYLEARAKRTNARCGHDLNMIMKDLTPCVLQTAGSYYLRTSIALLATAIPLITYAQQCPVLFQPYGNRCDSQATAEYISCVEAAGGNKAQIQEDVSRVKGNSGSASAKGEFKAQTVGGGGGLVLDKRAEAAVAQRIERRWFAGAGSDCITGMQPAQLAKKLSSAQQGDEQGKQKKSASTLEIFGVLVGNRSPYLVADTGNLVFVQPGVEIAGPGEEYRDSRFNFAIHVQNRAAEDVSIEQLTVKTHRLAGRVADRYETLAVRNADVVVIWNSDKDKLAIFEEVGPRFRIGRPFTGTTASTAFIYSPNSFDLRGIPALQQLKQVKGVRVYPRADTLDDSVSILDLQIPGGLEVAEGTVTKPTIGTFSGKTVGLVSLTIKFRKAGAYQLDVMLITDKGTVKIKPFHVLFRGK